MAINRFWQWVADAGEDSSGPPARELDFSGVIASESWFGDEVTPAAFKAELMGGKGPVIVRINSPGGDCVAAAMIYTMLRDYSAKGLGTVTVRVDGMAASAASVVAMAGDIVEMSPVGLMMIHNPWTVAMGERGDMKKAVALLDEVKESIVNAYELKTGMARTKLAAMMDAETWMSSGKALELGFIDQVRDWDAESGGAHTDMGKASWAMRPVAMAAINKALAQVRRESAAPPPLHFNHTHSMPTYSHALPGLAGNEPADRVATDDERALCAARMQAIKNSLAV